VLAVFPAVVGRAGALFNNMGGEGYNWPQGRNVTQYPIIDDVTKTLGPHTLKFGANLHRVDLSYFSYQTYLHGRITERNLSISTTAAEPPTTSNSASRRSLKRPGLLQPRHECAGRMAPQPASDGDPDTARRPQYESDLPGELFRQLRGPVQFAPPGSERPL
jgi:hypothetical protein